MQIYILLTFILLQAIATWAIPLDNWSSQSACSDRPQHPVAPYSPGKPFPPSPDRTKNCVVTANGDGTDDSKNILKAINDCNDGGHVMFPKDKKFIIGIALDLTFLKHIDLGKNVRSLNLSCSLMDYADIQGIILFTNDTKYWQANSFRHGFQNATTFFQLGGEDVNIYGGGTLEGNGQV